MKPTVKKQKDVRGRITGHVASIGPIEFSAGTPAAAVGMCEELTLSALERLDRGVNIGRWRGHLWLVEPTIEGWSYWIDTSSHLHCKVACQVMGTREDAENAALHHLAQNAWEPSVTDDAEFVQGLPVSVAKQISDWIGFQRRYAAARANGKTDHEAHQSACEACGA